MANTTAAPVATLLAPVTTITVTPQKEFDAQAFFEGKGWYLGPNFRKIFLGRKEKTNGEPVEIKINVLNQYSLDPPIIEELGGKEKAAIALAEFATVMDLQPDLEDGALLTNGYANVSYILDDDGTPWAVGCSRRDDRWRVGADSVGDPGGWGVGGRFLSLNS